MLEGLLKHCIKGFPEGDANAIKSETLTGDNSADDDESNYDESLNKEEIKTSHEKDRITSISKRS